MEQQSRFLPLNYDFPESEEQVTYIHYNKRVHEEWLLSEARDRFGECSLIKKSSCKQIKCNYVRRKDWTRSDLSG